MFVQNMADIGIQIVVDNSLDLGKPFGLALIGWGVGDLNLDAGRPGSFAANYRSTNTDVNWGHYNNPTVDGWIDLAEAATTRVDKLGYLQDIQVQVMNDLAILPIAERIGNMIQLPSFNVRANTDQIEAWDWPLDSTVTVRIYASGVESGDPDKMVSGVVTGPASWDPRNYISFNLWGEYDIQPGYLVVLSDDVDTTIRRTNVTSLAFDVMDADANTVSGFAAPESRVDLWACDNSNCFNRHVTADLDGKWIANWDVEGPQDDEKNTMDLVGGTWVDSSQGDEDGDSTMFGQNIRSPYIEGNPGSNWLHARDWPTGTELYLTIDDPIQGAGVFTATATMGQAPWNPGDPNDIVADFNLGGFDLKAGQTAHITDGLTPATERTYTFTNLSIYAYDLDADTISGTGADGVEVQVCINVPNNCISRTVIPSGGTWTVDYSGPDGLDLVPGNDGWTEQRDGNGNKTQADLYIPNPYIQANPGSNWVQAFDWPNGTELTLTINAGDPFTATVEPADWDPSQMRAWFDLGGFDLQAGDALIVTGGDTERTYTPTDLAMTGFDLESHTVSGVGSPGVEVQVCLNIPNNCISRYVTPDEFGSWTVGYSGFGNEDLVAGSNGWAAQPANGRVNQTWADWYIANPQIKAWLGSNAIDGYGWTPKNNVDLRVHVPGADEADDYVASMYADENGDLQFQIDLSSLQLAETQVVTMSDGLRTRTHTILKLTIDNVDVTTDVVSGTAEAGASVDVCMRINGCIMRRVVADEFGNWSVDFSAAGGQPDEQEYDIKWGDSLDAAVYDILGNGTGVDYFLPAYPPCQAGDSISGHVYGPDGTTPLEGAEVHFKTFATDQMVSVTNTDVNGAYQCGLAAGSYRVFAFGSGYSREYYQNEIFENATQMDVALDSHIANVDFTLDVPWFGYHELLFKMDDPIVGQLAVRQAIAFGTDRATMVAVTFPGSELLNSFMPSRYWAYPGVSLPDYSFDPTYARQILADAGWIDRNADGIRENEGMQPLHIVMQTTQLNNPGHPRSRLIPLFVQNMADIGIEIEVSTQPGLPGLNDHNFQLIMVGWAWVDLNADQPADLYENTYYTGNPGNYGEYSNPAADSLLDAAAAESTRSGKLPYLQDFEEQVMQDLAIFPLVEISGNLLDLTISGTIRDADGNPLNGILVRALLKSDGSEVSSSKSTSDGSYTLSGLPFEQEVVVVASDESPDMDGYPAKFYNNVSETSWAENILLDSSVLDRTGIDINLSTGGGAEQLVFNVGTDRILGNLDVRRAIAYGTDRQSILDTIWKPGGVTGQVLHSMVIPGLWYTAPTDDPLLTVYNFNTTTAQGILDAAGWDTINIDGFRENGDGEELTLDFITTDNGRRIASADLFRTQMAAIGIRVNVTTYPAGVFFDADPLVSPLAAGNFDIAEFFNGYDDDTLLGEFNTADPANFGSFSSTTLEGYYNAARNAKVNGSTSTFLENALNWQYTFSAELPSLPLFTRIPMTVGMVTDTGGINDQGFNWLSWQGVLQAETDLGIVGYLYESISPDEYAPLLQQCADDGNVLCIAVGWTMADAVASAASANPGTRFAIIDMPTDPGITNLRGLTFASDQVAYLAGALAGKMTTSNVIGDIGGNEIPPVTAFTEAYRNGAQCANPEVQVLLGYLYEFVNPDVGAAMAATMISQGADVIYAAGGPAGSGAIRYSAQHEKWSIGVDVDEYFSTFAGGTVDGSDMLLTSTMKRMDIAVYQTIQDVLNNNFTSGTAMYTLPGGGVGLAPYHETDGIIMQSVKDYVEFVRQGILDGIIDTSQTCRPDYNPNFSDRADPNEEVEAFGWPIGNTLTLEIDDPATQQNPDFADTRTVGVFDKDPSQGYAFFGLNGQFDIQPGFVITLTDGTISRTHTVTNLHFTSIDIDTDIVTGFANSFAQVDVWACDNMGCTNRSTTADEFGSWTVNFQVPDQSGNPEFDLARGTWVDSQEWDGFGQRTMYGQNIPNPFIDVAPYSRWIHGRDWPVGTEVTISIDDPSNGVGEDYSDTAIVEHNPDNPGDPNDIRADFAWPSIGLEPGFLVTMSGVANGTLVTKELTVANLQVLSANPDTDILSGVATPGTANLEVCFNQPDTCNSRYPIADVITGEWSVDYTIENLQPGDNGWVAEYDNDIDRTWFDWRVLNPIIEGNPGSNWLHARDWPTGTELYLTIDDPIEGAGVFTATATMGQAPWNPGDPNDIVADFNLGGFDLKAGQTAHITDGLTPATERTYTFTNLSIYAYDLDADTISGTGADGVEVQVCINVPNNCISRTVIPSGGTWTVDYSGPDGMDLVPGNDGWAAQKDANGNTTQADWYIPNPYIQANPGNNWVQAFDWPNGAELTLTINAGDPFTATVGLAEWDPKQTRAWFDLGGFDLQAGDALIVTGGGTERTYSPTDLAITGFDLDSHTVSGVGAPGVEVQVCLNIPNNCISRYVTPDEFGSWTVTYSGIGDEDLVAGSNGWAAQPANGRVNQTWADWNVPNPRFDAWYRDGNISAYDWPIDTVLTLEVEDPATPETPDYSTTTIVGFDPKQTMAQFNLNGAFSIQPGMTLSVSGAGVTKTLLVSDLAITAANPITDVISGTAGMNQVLWMYFDNASNNCCRNFQADADGNWTVDYSELGLYGEPIEDIFPGSSGTLNAPDEDGDNSSLSWYIPDPYYPPCLAGDTISGHVYALDGTNPVGGMTVHFDDFNTDETLFAAVTLQDGSFTCGGLPAGNYRIWADMGMVGNNWFSRAYYPDNIYETATQVLVDAETHLTGVDMIYQTPAYIYMRMDFNMSSHHCERTGCSPGNRIRHRPAAHT